MQVFKALAQGLIDHGVETLFGLMGDGNLYMANHYSSIPGATYIASAHEAGAVLMANGYASVSGEVGVATVTHGPGLANALPPLIDSVRSRMPMVLICGDTADGDRNTLQDIAQRELVLPTGAGFEHVQRPETAVQNLREALRRATAERRPIVLNVPADYMWKEVDYQHDPLKPADRNTTLDPDEMDQAVGIVAAAERPIVLAGRGAATPSARAAIRRLAERLGAPVATTLRGKSLFLTDPGALGVFGTLSTSAALDQIGKSDCVIAFGASLNSWTTDSGALLSGKRVVHCDTDPQAIARHIDVDAAVLGDAATIAHAIIGYLDEAEVPTRRFREDWIEKSADVEDYCIPTSPASLEGSIPFHETVRAIDRLIPEDRVVVVDAGRFMFAGYKLLHVPDPHSLVHTCNFGAIGLGMGNAIGAALAAQGRPVFLVCGDGGFMLGGITEFVSAVQNGIDLIVMVLNDSSYGAEHIQFRSRDMDPSRTLFQWPDLSALAIALGGEGVTMRVPDDLTTVEKAIVNRTRPLLIEVKLDPDDVPTE
ncbi:thiamine pyrophosphate-binding protein [Rhodococcus opacus]|uniref:acetolactate synthase n=1 Tax=Rhodococcus opacus TaxID=37919 RepID=A0A076ERG0_RHOOP|nr:thiamine pyrophosphate-binding protein [Rhodococcus opacus]AII07777.1 hypothetical protein EP51_25290 [Rhodococcus opacus]